MLPFLFILALYGNVYQYADAKGHAINCVKNPTEAVCEYKLNK